MECIDAADGLVALQLHLGQALVQYPIQTVLLAQLVDLRPSGDIPTRNQTYLAWVAKTQDFGPKQHYSAGAVANFNAGVQPADKLIDR